MAEIIGKKFMSKVIFNCWGQIKTVFGCLTVFFASFFGSLFFCYYIFGNYYIIRCLFGSLIGMITEFMSPPGLDNFFIPLPYIFIDFLFFSDS